MNRLKSYFKEHPMVFTLAYTVVYFTFFFILEKNIVPKYIIHSPIDDLIPFCEYFIIPYLLWFLYTPGILLFLMHKDRDSFWRMAKMMFLGNMICLLIYALFPNGVHAKHYVPSDNIFSFIVNIIYYTDTPTNVCPSIHVLDTLASHIALSRSPLLENKKWIKHLSYMFFLFVCVSTVTLKQHSIIDVFASLLLMLFLEKYAYKKDAQRKPAAIV